MSGSRASIRAKYNRVAAFAGKACCFFAQTRQAHRNFSMATLQLCVAIRRCSRMHAGMSVRRESSILDATNLPRKPDKMTARKPKPGTAPTTAQSATNTPHRSETSYDVAEPTSAVMSIAFIEGAMVDTHIDAVTAIRDCRERKVRGGDYANGLDRLIDVGQGAAFRVGHGIVNDDGMGRPTRDRSAGARQGQMYPLHFDMKE